RRVLVFAEFILVIFFYSFSIISLVPQLLSPFFFSFFIVPRPPIPSLFPYTTLFRSVGRAGAQGRWRRGGRFRPPGRGRRHREARSEEHTSELQSRENLVCRLLLGKKKRNVI